MARRKYPFYSPVNHRVADSYRRDISRGVRKITDMILMAVVVAIIYGAILAFGG